MIRYFLARGDRAGSATIIEGLPDCTCSDPLPRVEIATLYMKTWCQACGREGFIAPEGPRWPGTASNGKPWALSGDINVCGCSPSPVFYAERGMKMSFTAEQVIALVDPAISVRRSGAPASGAIPSFDQHFRFVDESGNPVAGIRVYLTDVNGQISQITTDGDGRTPIMAGSDGQEIGASLSEGNN